MNGHVITLDDAIDVAMQLPPDQRDMLVEILRHRQIEARREEMAQSAKEEIAAFHAGQLTPQSAEEVIQDLR